MRPVSGISQTLVPADTPDVTDTSVQTSTTRQKGDNTNFDSDGFSVDDAMTMGYSQEDAEAIGSGGQVETVFSPNPGTESEFNMNNNPPTAEDTYQTARETSAKKMREAYFKK